VLVFVLWPLAPHLMAWTGASPEVQENAAAYMQIRLFGAFGLMLLMACDNFYRGIGRTDVPMWFGFVKVFLNSGANYVFIFGHFGVPAMGAVGAAVGTAIANTVIGFAMFAYLFLRPEFRDVYQLLPRVRFHRRVFRALVVLSLPIGIQTFMEMGGFSVFTAVVARLGDPQLAATDAVIHAWSAAFMIAFSLSVAAQTLVGQCIGAGAKEDARRVTLRILRLGGGIMLVLALVYVLLPET
jgi:MATE family multidrug resistance protein